MKNVCLRKAEYWCETYPHCSGCLAYGIPTNADRIRSMSDEEIADFLYFKLLDEDGSRDLILEWLKRPYKENTDE